jgi:hypothetical protein
MIDLKKIKEWAQKRNYVTLSSAGIFDLLALIPEYHPGAEIPPVVGENRSVSLDVLGWWNGEPYIAYYGIVTKQWFETQTGDAFDSPPSHWIDIRVLQKGG